LKTLQIITVRKKAYNVAKVPGQNDNLTLIDFLALKCYRATSDKEKEMFFEELLKLARPYITYTASRYTKREQDKQDLISILSQDLWRLINKWEPNEKYNSSRFHYLMLKQLRNQAYNEVQRFAKANTPIKESDLKDEISDIGDLVSNNSTTQTELNTFTYKNIIKKLLERVENGDTLELLKMMLQDLSINEIKKLTGRKSALAIKRRQESVRPIIIDLLYGSCTLFIRDITARIEDAESKKIIAYYCIGKTVQEIKILLKLPVSTVRTCVDKYKSVVYSMLMGS